MEQKRIKEDYKDIQPIEWIDDTLVIYSLGNFLSAHEVVNMDNRVGLMTSVDITKKV